MYIIKFAKGFQEVPSDRRKKIGSTGKKPTVDQGQSLNFEVFDQAWTFQVNIHNNMSFGQFTSREIKKIIKIAELGFSNFFKYRKIHVHLSDIPWLYLSPQEPKNFNQGLKLKIICNTTSLLKIWSQKKFLSGLKIMPK